MRMQYFSQPCECEHVSYSKVLSQISKILPLEACKIYVCKDKVMDNIFSSKFIYVGLVLSALVTKKYMNNNSVLTRIL